MGRQFMAEEFVVKKCLYRSRKARLGGIAGLMLGRIWSSGNQSRQNVIPLLD